MSSSTVRAGPSRRSFDHPGPPRGDPVYSVDGAKAAQILNAPAHPDDRPEQPHKHKLPPLDLPGFKQPGEDCGEYIPEAMAFCDCCGDVKERRHICFRYDCKNCAPYAIRRRAAGSASGSGIIPRMDALRRYLNAYRDDNQFFHHLIVSFPDDFYFQSENPLERAFEMIRELMDLIGIQGVVAFHPFRGENEDHGEDDRGKWRKRLFHKRDWQGDVREELKYSPHFHIVGVAPLVDFSESGIIYDETGFIVRRRTSDVEGDNKSISGRKGEKTDDHAMARVVNYVLSHAGIYETESGQRRLAARMKGPDVGRAKVLPKNESRARAIAYDAGYETLGLTPPTAKCEEEIVPTVGDVPDRRETGDLSAFDRASDLRDPLEPEPLRGYAGPEIATTTGPTLSSETFSGAPDTSGRATGSRSASSPGRGAGGGWSGFDSSGGGNSAGGADRDGPSLDVDGEAETEPCGGHVRHISQAGERLLDDSWRQRAPSADDLETAYVSYVECMTADGRDPLQDVATIPEERDRDHVPDRGPPPDA